MRSNSVPVRNVTCVRSQPKWSNASYPRIETLTDEPRPAGAKKLSGDHDVWRIRIGDYCILYAINDDIRIVEVRKVGHRKDIYL